MRVVLLPSAYPPAVGGVEELSRHLALTLSQGGHDVEVWTGKDVATGPPLVRRQDGLTIRRFALALPRRDPSAAAQAMGRGVATLWGMRRAVAEFRPDVLHVQCFGPNGLYGTALAGWLGIPLVITLQGETAMDDHAVFEGSSLLRRGLAQALAHAEVVTACSAMAADDAYRFGAPKDRITVIPNGVALEQEDGTPTDDEPLANFPGPFVFGVGRLVTHKGFDLLIRAFARLGDRHHSLRLLIGGGGPQRDELARLAAAPDLAGRVLLLGPLTRAAVRRAMAEAEMFVLPSRIEPFGIVVLEAWRSATPVIASPRGGPTEFVRNGEDGLLVDPLDSEALAGAMGRLLDDRPLASALGNGGHRRVAEFAWPVIAERYRACYQRAVALRIRSGSGAPGHRPLVTS